jgi:hypothetical protein
MLLSKRLLHGIGWGVISAVVVGLIPTAAVALGIWPAPTRAPITPSLFAQILGTDPMGFPTLLLSVFWQFIYGGFWGAFLAYVTGPFGPYEEPLARPSMLWYGAGVGLFRFFIANLTALLYLGWGPFAVMASPIIALAILVSDLGYGLLLAWFVSSEEAGLLALRVPRLRLPARLVALVRGARGQVTTTHVIRPRRSRR